MNITHDKATERVQHLRIEVNKADYFENVETALKKYRRTTQIPGFRVGNAPMGLIRRNYEKPLITDEVNKITSQNLYDYFEKNSINIMFEPVLIEEESTFDFGETEDFVFTFEFAIQPQFEIDFAALPLMETFKIEADKEEIEDFINQLRRRHGDYINPETIEDDDYVSVKWNENENGFFFIKDLTENGKSLLLGKKMEDKVTVKFNELFLLKESLKKFLKKVDENFDENETGTDVELQISSIGRVTLAEMNEEFFKKAFPDGSVTSVQALEKHAAQQIEIQWKQETDRKFMNDAITLLMQHVEIDLPEDFIKRYLLRNNSEITEEKLTQEWKSYVESIKWQLIESKLGKDENIEVTLADVKNHIKNFYYQNYFMQFNLADVEERLNQLVEEAVKDKKQVKQLYDQLFDHKLMELLQKKMNVEEITGDFNQFITFMTGKETPEVENKKQKAKNETSKAENTETEEKPKKSKRSIEKKD